MTKLKISLIAILMAVATIITPLNASAAPAQNPSNGGNGLRISPVRSTITIEPGKTQTVNIYVTNVTTVPAVIKGVVNDFTAKKDETGSPAVILDPNQYSSSHSLKRFTTPLGKYSLNPGQTITVPVEIKVPANAAGGGYFGVVRFAPASSSGAENSNVSLAGSVGSLILAKVPGDYKELMTLKSFDVRQKDDPSSIFTTNKNLTSTIRFENKGNVHEQPFGKIILRDRSGKIIYQTEVNNTIPPSNVLPDSIRKFNVPLKNVGSFGKYKVEGNFGYGSSGQLLSATTTFYVIPKAVIIGVIFLIFLILFLIFGMPKLIRAYNRRVLRNARRH